MEVDTELSEVILRARWKVISGAGLGLGVALFIVGHSRLSHGDTTPDAPPPTASPPPSTGTTPTVAHDQLAPYDLGPHAIPYEQLSAAGKADVDAIQERVELSQPAASYLAYSSGTASAAADAQAQKAARIVGLVDTAQDGVP